MLRETCYKVLMGPRELYTSLVVTSVPIWVPIQQLLVPSFTLVVGQARTFYLALI